MKASVIWDLPVASSAWTWTSPNGRITHTYEPVTFDCFALYITKGWSVTAAGEWAKGEAQ